MGPGPSGPGNTCPRRSGTVKVTCFNGAGTERSRKCEKVKYVAATALSFNGAGTERSRKYVYDEHLRGKGKWLQWGRDRAVPEMVPLHARPGVAGEASMGPGPSGPGNARWHGRGAERSHASMGPGPSGPGNVPGVPFCKLVQPGFNGAGTERSRKYGRNRWQPSPYSRASMGPGPSGPGNFIIYIIIYSI